MKYNYAPPVKDLRTSLRFRSKEFLLENTLHGVPYFIDHTRPKWERIVWFCLTMASLGGTIAIIITIWDKFQREPTITGLNLQTYDMEIDFPQVFICYDWSQLNHSQLDQSNLQIYEKVYNWNWGQAIQLESSQGAYATMKNFRNTFKTVGLDCGIIFSGCTFRGVEESCSQIFTKVVTPVGTCCKFNGSTPLTLAESQWELTFMAKKLPLRLYLLKKGDSYPERNERALIKAYYQVEVHFLVEFTYATADIRHLTRRQRQCHTDNEELSLSDCELRCLADEILRRCGCLPWFLSSDKDECPITRYSCVKKMNVDYQACRCSLTCDHTSYRPKRTTLIQGTNEVSKIKLMNWPDNAYKREMRFGYLDMLVSFGGIAGVFLGYSLLTSVEMGYYFSLRAYCGAVVESSRKKHNIVTVKVIEAKLPRKLDVNPVYYQYVD